MVAPDDFIIILNGVFIEDAEEEELLPQYRGFQARLRS